MTTAGQKVTLDFADNTANMSGDDDSQEQTIADDLVVTKYKMGAEIANQALKTVVEAALPGVSVLSLCQKGDAFVMAETGKIFKKEKDMKKGSAFPTCVSVNNTVCHHSPLKSDPDVILKDGDVVKIDLGVHVDGFISNVAHSFVVGVTKENPLTGRKADVLIAAHLCAEAAIRLVKPGNKNSQVTDAWNKIAKSFKCSPIEGMLSHQLKQHVIDGRKQSSKTQRTSKKRTMRRLSLKCMRYMQWMCSSALERERDGGQRTTVYKRDPNKVYGLKMKTSRTFFSEMERRFDTMPFTLRAFEDEGKARLGEFVAQFKFTVLLMANGPLRITNSLFDPDLYKSEHEVQDEELKTLLQSSASRKTQKKKKKKATKTVETATGQAMETEAAE
ncbi:hypothetical protein F7725_000698 [Dissostichus mawsoni]|uniref:Peptidase M24 domain-containing protein n=1 Tax=Dissostichus mawsoni TaxID=36200 RepID=A0A7J5ZFR9_DISMA|nr:hypothetical protein F7725_000698 [Dissostichus mawsoni]